MSTGFRPLSTRTLCDLELRNLNPIDTSWSAFNYYIRTARYVVYIGMHRWLLHVVGVNLSERYRQSAPTTTTHDPTTTSQEQSSSVQQLRTRTTAATTTDPIQTRIVVTCTYIFIHCATTLQLKSNRIPTLASTHRGQRKLYKVVQIIKASIDYVRI